MWRVTYRTASSLTDFFLVYMFTTVLDHFFWVISYSLPYRGSMPYLAPIVFTMLVGSMWTQAAQTLFVIYIRDSITLRFEPFKRMYENNSKIVLNSTLSKGFK